MLPMSIRSFLSNRLLAGLKNPAKRAEQAVAEGRYADAVALYRPLADDGDADAQFRLAQLYERGQGVVQSFVGAVRWFQAAAEKGHVAAQARLGEVYLTGLEAPATATASAIAQIESSEAEDSMLKRLFPQGLAVKKNPEQAAIWNASAAAAGDGAAQARLAYQYATGLGVAQDLPTAERWFSSAAGQDHVAGQLGLGMLHAGSYGAYGERTLAVEWFEKAAAQGNAMAKLCLAMLLLYAEDLPRDETRAPCSTWARSTGAGWASRSTGRWPRAGCTGPPCMAM
jgi:TPR repeat protein